MYGVGKIRDLCNVKGATYTRSTFIFRDGLLFSGNLSVSEGTQYTYAINNHRNFW